MKESTLNRNLQILNELKQGKTAKELALKYHTSLVNIYMIKYRTEKFVKKSKKICIVCKRKLVVK